MARLKGLSLEDHQTLGIKLNEMRNELMRISIQLSTAYGVKGYNQVDRITKQIDKLRSDMENNLAHEDPTFKGIVNVYYGNLSGTRPKY